MTKINKEEYRILKGLNDTWKWIAKDKNTALWVYKEKPSKYHEDCWDEYMDACEELDSALFQFIQWEDEEPYNISELIEEYESKETEVKGSEWLKEEMSEILLTSKKDGTNYFYYRDLKEKIYNAIDQLDEPETIEQTTLLLESTLKENKRLGELLEEKHEEWLELMDKINNQETLKKPTIPQFVAEFLRGKEEYMLYELLDNDFIYDDYDELAKWLYNNDEDTNKEREFSLVLAQRYGYEVEEEQKLTARDLIEKHIELLKNQEEAVNLKPYYDLLERVKNE